MMHRASPRSPQAGFTLIELIIASSVTVGIIGSVFLCFLSGRRTQRTVEVRSEMLQNARVAIERIAADLTVACPLHRDFALLGMDRVREEADGQPGIEADNIDFATHNWRPQRTGERDYCETSYFVDRDPETGELSLYRRRDPTPDDKPLEGGTREMIATGVRAFRLEYLGGALWENKWGSLPETRGYSNDPSADMFANSMPEAVRVSIAITKPHDHRAGPPPKAEEPTLIVQRIVYLPLATRFNDTLLGGFGDAIPGMGDVDNPGEATGSPPGGGQ